MFDTLINDAQLFLRALSHDNTRDWFHAHKSEYDSKLRDPAKALLETMSPKLTTLTGFDVTPKLFRAHRDVRFSKDKTPYTTHLHMMWAVEAGARQNPVVFFGINLTEVTVGTGMMEFSKDVLMDWRKMVDLDGDHMVGRIRPVTDKGYALWEPKLKRVPPPFDKDHPHGDLLRQKGLVATGQPEMSGDLVEHLDGAFGDLWPLSDMLIGVAETPTL
ncbi:DUF2461 domain-containing protein [Octadecabacter sp. 1_MG-2023]|uniref:TIGR02453 family protein n=1 Tax=unclassified Octadecabacter TaxID=196158 RepID=UPI001C08D3E7|nr:MULTISPECIES: DUF2461 domain-containing protein [unclassified Octadecabacter]MBU2992801.1 DUF2461 domain-containing protein [Octadecabacter sp. B2R22]MDO6733748.1 DUF2461 domain-containing protein [Octadecabacter sp. 1_MG-2023]